MKIGLFQILLVAIVAHAVIMGGTLPTALIGISLVALEAFKLYREARFEQASSEALRKQVDEMFKEYTKEFNARLSSVDSKFAASAIFGKRQ